MPGGTGKRIPAVIVINSPGGGDIIRRRSPQKKSFPGSGQNGTRRTAAQGQYGIYIGAASGGGSAYIKVTAGPVDILKIGIPSQSRDLLPAAAGILVQAAVFNNTIQAVSRGGQIGNRTGGLVRAGPSGTLVVVEALSVRYVEIRPALYYFSGAPGYIRVLGFHLPGYIKKDGMLIAGKEKQAEGDKNKKPPPGS
jgi:hypothetical protein